MPFRHHDVPFLSQFPDLKLLRQDGSTVAASEAFKGKRYVLIYFSAHWCPPCQRFTPLLADFYEAHKDRHGFEVLFVSSDREEGRMMDFFQNRSSNYVRRPPPVPNTPNTGHNHQDEENCRIANLSCSLTPEDAAAAGSGGAMEVGCEMPDSMGDSGAHSLQQLGASSSLPATRGSTLVSRRGQAAANGPRVPKANGHGPWLALPFKENDVARFLSRAYSVVSIPKLVVVAVDTSCMVTREGKAMVMRDPDATRFPWRFAEGDMQPRSEGWRECFFILLLMVGGLYWYLWM